VLAPLSRCGSAQARGRTLVKWGTAELSGGGGVSTMVPMRRSPAYLLVALAVTACAGTRVGPAASPSRGGPAIAPDPCSGYTCSGPGARLNVAYPYRLHTHCGVLGAPFDGRAF
jgi:hypothetical protein